MSTKVKYRWCLRCFKFRVMPSCNSWLRRLDIQALLRSTELLCNVSEDLRDRHTQSSLCAWSFYVLLSIGFLYCIDRVSICPLRLPVTRSLRRPRYWIRRRHPAVESHTGTITERSSFGIPITLAIITLFGVFCWGILIPWILRSGRINHLATPRTPMLTGGRGRGWSDRE